MNELARTCDETDESQDQIIIEKLDGEKWVKISVPRWFYITVIGEPSHFSEQDKKWAMDKMIEFAEYLK